MKKIVALFFLSIMTLILASTGCSDLNILGPSSSNFGVISGKVYWGHSNGPIVQEGVFLWNYEGGDRPKTWGEFVKSVKTDEKGHYKFIGVKNGDYLVFCNEYTHLCFVPENYKISMKNGKEIKDINFSLIDKGD